MSKSQVLPGFRTELLTYYVLKRFDIVHRKIDMNEEHFSIKNSWRS